MEVRPVLGEVDSSVVGSALDLPWRRRVVAPVRLGRPLLRRPWLLLAHPSSDLPLALLAVPVVAVLPLPVRSEACASPAVDTDGGRSVVRVVLVRVRLERGRRRGEPQRDLVWLQE